MAYVPFNPTPWMPPQNAFPFVNNTVQTSELVRVNGLDGAKAYQMPANSTVALFDQNEDVMYIKSTDGAGFPTIRIFEFKEVGASVVSNDNYVTKDEFDKFKQEILNAQQSVQQPVQQQPVAVVEYVEQQPTSPTSY